MTPMILGRMKPSVISRKMRKSLYVTVDPLVNPIGWTPRNFGMYGNILISLGSLDILMF